MFTLAVPLFYFTLRQKCEYNYIFNIKMFCFLKYIYFLYFDIYKKNVNIHVSNTLCFWSVHGNMNTSGLLQSTIYARYLSIHDSRNIPKMCLMPWLHLPY